jgi:hypothetical protein
MFEAILMPGAYVIFPALNLRDGDVFCRAVLRDDLA